MQKNVFNNRNLITNVGTNRPTRSNYKTVTKVRQKAIDVSRMNDEQEELVAGNSNSHDGASQPEMKKKVTVKNKRVVKGKKTHKKARSAENRAIVAPGKVVCKTHGTSLMDLRQSDNSRKALSFLFRKNPNSEGFLFGHSCYGDGETCGWPYGDFDFKRDDHVQPLYFCMSCETDHLENPDFNSPVFYCQCCFFIEQAKQTKMNNSTTERRSGRSTSGKNTWLTRDHIVNHPGQSEDDDSDSNLE
jgi:hypothetical protein